MLTQSVAARETPVAPVISVALNARMVPPLVLLTPTVKVA